MEIRGKQSLCFVTTQRLLVPRLMNSPSEAQHQRTKQNNFISLKFRPYQQPTRNTCNRISRYPSVPLTCTNKTQHGLPHLPPTNPNPPPSNPPAPPNHFLPTSINARPLPRNVAKPHVRPVNSLPHMRPHLRILLLHRPLLPTRRST